MVAMIRPITSMGATSALKSMAPYVDDAAILAARQGMATQKGPQAKLPTSIQSGVKTTVTNPIDTGLGLAERATGIAGMVPFLAMPLAFVGKLPGWVGNKTGFRPMSKVGEWMGAPQEYLGRELGETALAKPIGAMNRGIASTTAGVVGRLDRATGLGGFMQRRHTARAAKTLEKSRELFAKLPMEHAPLDALGHIQGMREIVHSKGPLDAKQLGRLETLMEETAKHAGGANKAFAKPFKKLSKSLRATASHHGSVGHWGNLEKGIKEIPGNLNKMDLGHVAMNSAFAAGSAVSMAADVRSFGKDMAALKQMYFDLTGKHISTVGLLTSKVPPVISDARGKLLKTLAVKEAADAVSMGISLKELTNRHFNGSAKAIIGFMAANMIGSSAEGFIGENGIAAYEQMKSSFDKTKPMPAEYYAQYVGELSKELRKRGGASSKYTQAVAQQYADEGTTPQQILQEINSGKLMKRINGLIAAQPHPAETKKTPRTIVGEHTAKVMSRDGAQTQHPGPAVT